MHKQWVSKRKIKSAEGLQLPKSLGPGSVLFGRLPLAFFGLLACLLKRLFALSYYALIKATLSLWLSLSHVYKSKTKKCAAVALGLFCIYYLPRVIAPYLQRRYLCRGVAAGRNSGRAVPRPASHGHHPGTCISGAGPPYMHLSTKFPFDATVRPFPLRSDPELGSGASCSHMHRHARTSTAVFVASRI